MPSQNQALAYYLSINAIDQRDTLFRPVPFAR